MKRKIFPGMKKISFDSKEFKKIIALRREVFCGEKGEKASFVKDVRDEQGIHTAYYLGDDVVACGSAYNVGNGDFELRFVCVKEGYRRFKVGSAVIDELRAESMLYGAKQLVCRAPVENIDFLKSNGIPYENVSYIKDGKRHINFRENLVFEGAKWLSFREENQAVIAKKDFYLEKKEKTELYVTGLGFCYIYINGKCISDRVLAPAWTNYKEHDTATMSYPIFDKMTYRILYEKIDVTKFLKKGNNTIVFHIGGGWFCQNECPNEGVKSYGTLKLCFKLMQGKNSVCISNEDVKYRKSFVEKTNIYYGETHDARLGGYDFSVTDENAESYLRAEVVEKPVSVFDEQDCIPDKVIRKIKPNCIFKKGDYAIYDLGENISGYPVVEFTGNPHANMVCTLRYAEILAEDGSLDFSSAGWGHRIQRDTFIQDGQKKDFHPLFTWHACRFIELQGSAVIKEYRVCHTDIKPRVNFKNSDPTIQWIFDAFIRTQQSNTHGCVPSDCPHRERLGYTGDGQLTADAVMLCFDAEKMYRKWIRDIADSQDIYNGHVQHTAPFYGGGGGPGGWGGAMVFVPYSFYKAYGDKELVKKYYVNMLAYLDYMESHSENGIVVREERLGWCLGDWCSPDNKNLIPEPFVNTYFYIKAIKNVIELSKEIGEPVKELENRLKKVEKSFLDKYYDKKTCTFIKSTESADAYGYDLGYGNEKTLQAIVEKYENLGEFDTGIFGTKLLIKVLCKNGHKNLAFKLLSSQGENTFYNMKRQGATTLWENWNGEASHSHPMFGAVVEEIVKYFNEE